MASSLLFPPCHVASLRFVVAGVVVGAAVGWIATFALYRNKFDAFLIVPTGIVVWVMTVAVGMVLRAVTGQGTAGSFIVVATLSTAVLLLGWRALAKFVPSVR